jgi:hypothetical protein
LRTFIDSILSFIGAVTLSDAEWATLSDLTDLHYTLANYTRILAVVDAREAVSGVRDRLTFYFQAAGVEIAEPETKSNIYIGDAL